ncbi:MAG: DUF4140 domain-containing protein, partial [Proteobacteria bacterium]|nr:DUF4140 domain-containing protein [Pseudomonadota bacterium]
MGARKWTWLPGFILAAAVVTPALSGTPEPLEVKTKITEVTVYPRRAQIKRVGELTVPAGVHRIHLTRLPYRLLTQSVRVKLMGPAGLSFMGVEVQSKYHRQVTSPEEKTLRRKLEALLDKYRRISDRINIINGQLQFLRNLSRVTARRVGDQVLIKLPATKDIDALMSFGAKKSLELLDQRRALNQKRAELNQDMRVVRSELGKIRRG